jgi:PAS domain S-box-containing protein
MTSASVALAMLFLGQALVALSCAVVMGWLHRSYARQYLKLWTAALVCCAFARGAVALRFSMAPSGQMLSDAPGPVLVTLAAASLSLAFLAAATYALGSGREIGRSALAGFCSGVSAMGLGLSLALAGEGYGAWTPPTVVLCALGSPLCAVLGAWLFARHHRSSAPGPRLVAIGLALYGIPLAGYGLLVAPAAHSSAALYGLIAFAGVDVALLAATGVAGSLWFFEQERGRALQHRASEQKLLGDLEAGEQRFAAVMDQIDDAIAVADLDGRIRSDLRPRRQPLGYRAEELTGRSIFELIAPEDRERARVVFEKVRTESGAVSRAELHVRHSDGSWRIVEFTAKNCEDVRDLRGILIVGHDVTDERRMRDRLAEAERLESVGRLAGGVAHDFNNLLQVISGNAEMLRDELPLSREAERSIAEIELAARMGASLTQRLLAFARQQPIEPVVIDLNPLVSGILPLVERLVGEQVTVRSNDSDRPAWICADPAQIEQQLINLAANGRDAMPEGGELEISIRVIPATPDGPAGEVELCVSDTGVGMSSEVARRAFEPFYSTKEPGRGSGLGLATVYGAVTQLGGSVKLETNPGRGTRVRLRFPLADEPSAAR